MINVTSIAGGSVPDKARDELRKLQANLQVILDSQEIFAQITRSKFDSLIAQGFTPDQALELCK